MDLFCCIDFLCRETESHPTCCSYNIYLERASNGAEGDLEAMFWTDKFDLQSHVEMNRDPSGQGLALMINFHRLKITWYTSNSHWAVCSQIDLYCTAESVIDEPNTRKNSR